MLESYEMFINALEQVESNGREGVIGRNGELGPLQIKEEAWRDALQFLRKMSRDQTQAKIALPYAYCAYRTFSRIIVWLYFRRYRPDDLAEGNWEALARLWNGGPRWHLKKNAREHTEAYWHKVKAEMEKVS